MPKRKRAAERRQKQLYLIFDDWSLGYSIREVSLPSGPSNHPAAISGEVAEQRLPPPLLRMAAPPGLPNFFAHAFGSSIMAAHPEDRLSVGTPEAVLPILDVRKRSLIFGPSLGFPLSPIFVPVGGSRLFALHSDCLHLLRRAPRQPPPDNHIPVEWDWSMLPDPPFLTIEVVSYAVHPDGPSILLSTKRRTFTFHTKKSVWAKRGKWGLPFTGKAHFDGDLGILVGLSKDRKTRGHLCSCDRTSLALNTGNDSTDEELPAAPAWKLFFFREHA